MQTIKGGWELFYGMSAGIGGVYIARWFWWRVNAWSEIAAWISSAVVYSALYLYNQHHPTELYTVYGWRLITVTAVSTVAWLTATLLTRPVDEEKLVQFYKKVKPGSPFWKPIARRVHGADVERLAWLDIIDWLLGIVVVYAFLFGIGKLVLTDYLEGTIYLAVGFLAATVIYWHFTKKGWGTESP
ncbi:MAG: hypothetical protein D6743_13490 [Calditrichaeota bacterium]|nr:MAG: hypothetical protein D6743_13490 [Calditrichota bacterium]